MKGLGVQAGRQASSREVANTGAPGQGPVKEASHGLTAARRESPVDWDMGEAENLEVFPEYLFTGSTCMERLGSLLVSSLSFVEVGFLGKEEKRQAWVLGLGVAPSSESSMIPSEELCFLKGMGTKKWLRLPLVICLQFGPGIHDIWCYRPQLYAV